MEAAFSSESTASGSQEIEACKRLEDKVYCDTIDSTKLTALDTTYHFFVRSFCCGSIDDVNRYERGCI